MKIFISGVIVIIIILYSYYTWAGYYYKAVTPDMKILNIRGRIQDKQKIFEEKRRPLPNKYKKYKKKYKTAP